MPVRINEVVSEVTALDVADLLTPAFLDEVTRRVAAMQRSQTKGAAALEADRAMPGANEGR